MKRVKYIITAITLCAAALCSAMFCACNGGEDTWEDIHGEFFTLQQAYGDGWLTKDDLQEIAELHNENNSLDISEIDNQTIDKIKQTALNKDKEHEPDAKIEDYIILRYYGCYDDCYVLIMNSPYAYSPAVIVDEWKDIGGVQFHYRSFDVIYVWKEVSAEEQAAASVMSLEEAFDMGYLTENDLMYISYYLNGSVYKVPSGSDDINDESKWIKVDFIPEHAMPALGSEIEEKIKTAYYYNNIQYFQDENGNLKYGKDILEVEYFGCYNNVYVARVDSEYWSYGAVLQTVKIGDIIWQQNAPSVMAYIVGL